VGLEDRTHEGPLPSEHAAGFVPDPVRGVELGVAAEPLTVGLVVGQGREGEQGQGLVAGAFGGQEVSVMDAAACIHEPDPGTGEVLEGVELGAVDGVGDDAGDQVHGSLSSVAVWLFGGCGDVWLAPTSTTTRDASM